jgi:hypothetical protein
MRRTFLGVLTASLVLVAANAAARVHTGKLGGIILQRNGRPAAGIEVVLERSDGSAPVAVRTNSEGAFLFKYIRVGLYDVRAASGSTASTWKHNVMVHAGRETVLNLRLEPLHRTPAPNRRR